MLKDSPRLFIVPLTDRRAPLFESPLAIVWFEDDTRLAGPGPATSLAELLERGQVVITGLFSKETQKS